MFPGLAATRRLLPVQTRGLQSIEPIYPKLRRQRGPVTGSEPRGSLARQPVPRVNGASCVTEDNFWHHCGGGVWERNMLPVERSGGAVQDHSESVAGGSMPTANNALGSHREARRGSGDAAALALAAARMASLRSGPESLAVCAPVHRVDQHLLQNARGGQKSSQRSLDSGLLTVAEVCYCVETR